MHAFEYPCKVFDRQQCVFIDELQQRYARCRAGLQIGNDKNLIDGILRKLGVDIESAYAFYFIAERIDAIGKIGRKRINVDDTAPDGKLSRLINVIDPLETITRKKVGYRLWPAAMCCGVILRSMPPFRTTLRGK